MLDFFVPYYLIIVAFCAEDPNKKQTLNLRRAEQEI